MSDQIFLTIVTNDPEKAIVEALDCPIEDKPKWLRLMSEPMEILRIPSGTKCYGVFFFGRKHLSGAELAWRDRRLEGGLDYLSDQDWDRINAWVDRYRAKKRGDGIEPTPPEEDRRSMLPHPQPELRNLVLTQRWT